MKLLIGGSSSKLFHLNEFAEKLEKNNIKCKVVFDSDYADWFPSRKIQSWFNSNKKFKKLIKDFQPDVIFVDYLNICASQRIRPGAGANSYTLVKSIAEELRGVAVEYDVPIMSATQTTRSGFGSTDIGLEDTSESFGLPATADLMFALITSEELEELDQLVVKQLKNRYNDPTIFKRFVIGVDRSRMKLYDVEQEAQEELVDGELLVDDSIPVADRARATDKFNDFKV